MKLKRPLHGSEIGVDVRMVQRALNKWVRPSVGIPITSEYDQRTTDRMVGFQVEQDIKPARGDFGQKTLDALWPYFDAYGRWRYQLYRPPKPQPWLPDLGPVWKGGKSVLEQDLTHATSGLPLYPAFDDAFVEGRELIAPERMRVTRDSSSHPGDAFYALGVSRLRYWFGHLAEAPTVGTKFEKGEFIGVVGPNTIGGGPHVHVGVNVELLFGPGSELEHHTNYTHGAPTIGTQLAKVSRG